jgi:hypothetical protein
VLYAPWVLTAAAYPSTWTDGEDVPRASGLTAAQFKDTYELPNQPVVMTDWTTGWGAHERWTPDSLSKTHPHAMLEVFDDYAGPMSLQLSSYLEYGTVLCLIALRCVVPCCRYQQPFSSVSIELVAACSLRII